MSRFHALKIAEIARPTTDSIAIGFAVPEELRATFAFAPGQYLTLRANVDGEDLRRSYSICSAVGEALIRVGVKKIEGGAFSAFANENLKVGDIVETLPPEGRFTLKEGAARRHVLGIAAGSGITPILSIAKTLLAREPLSRFTLIFGNRTSQSVMFAEEIEDLKDAHLGRFVVAHVLSREPQDVPVLSGRIDAARIHALARDVIDLKTVDEAFVCGPQAMVEEARAALAELGLASDRVRVELFTANAPRAHYKAPASAEPGAVVARIAVTLDGKRNEFDMLASDENVIDAAARVGLDLPYSCKGGMCCTCRCKVTEGAVKMAANYSLEPWETEAGFVLGCQSTPTTPRVSLEFDHT